MNAPLAAVRPQLDPTEPITVAVLAMGGQGGGVLIDWIVALAESRDYIAQSTSVPGVAQRTGATIYYVEMIPAPADAARRPVLSLMPAPGELDVVVGAELMEAGRAIQRGLVAPDRTILISSSHRSYAVAEKAAPGDGVADAAKVYAAAGAAAKTFVAFDMAKLADDTGSVISAVLFGALAGSGALPFPREAYEATIRAAGIGVAASLRGFAGGFDAAAAAKGAARPPAPPPPSGQKIYPALAPIGEPGFDALVARARAAFPDPLHGLVAAGLQCTVDFQDVAYGAEYLDLLERLHRSDAAASGWALTRAAAKHLARAMAYDDVIRVADLKTRARRFARIRREVVAADDQLVYTTEFMHPRIEEVCGTLPAGLGRWIESRPRLVARLDRLVNRGRRVRTGTVRWFLVLYALAGLRPIRRSTLRHGREVAHRDAWLARVRDVAARDPALAVEILELRRLVKGYSDTHARGQSKFDKVMAAAARLDGRADAADWVRRLRQAALADEPGRALDGALETVATFV